MEPHLAHLQLVRVLAELRQLSKAMLARWEMYGSDADLSDFVYDLDIKVDNLELAVRDMKPEYPPDHPGHQKLLDAIFGDDTVS